MHPIQTVNPNPIHPIRTEEAEAETAQRPRIVARVSGGTNRASEREAQPGSQVNAQAETEKEGKKEGKAGRKVAEHFMNAIACGQKEQALFPSIQYT